MCFVRKVIFIYVSVLLHLKGSWHQILNKLYSKRKTMTEQVKYMYIWYEHIRTKIIVLFFNLELMITILGRGGMNMMLNHQFQQYLRYRGGQFYLWSKPEYTENHRPTASH